jgi:hypothetical protein
VIYRRLSGVEARLSAAAIIPAFRQQMQLVSIACDQSLFLFPAPSLDLFFPGISIVDTVAFLAIYEFYWQLFSCVVGAHAVLMLP